MPPEPPRNAAAGRLAATGRVRLAPIVEAASIERTIATRTRDERVDDEMALLAIVTRLESIGEVAGQLTDGARGRTLEIPWPRVIGVDSHFVHLSSDIDADTDVGWEPARSSVPEIAAAIANAPPSYAPD
ncbi:MAG TPA: hypothetical protein PKC43_08345 [Phycisphaerales bacterium]|nr:hypothetical protein [Phycisphaerales bacterium]HMP37445.1 hypothetical protein [Phycisphaerales bacterium]